MLPIFSESNSFGSYDCKICLPEFLCKIHTFCVNPYALFFRSNSQPYSSSLTLINPISNIFSSIFLNNLIMTFIIHHPDGTREQYSNHYDEDIESERDAAFDDAYMKFPDCYIESF